MDNIFAITAASFVSAILASMGMGGGSILLIYLTTFMQMGQLEAQGINLVFFIPIAAVALFIHSKNKLIKWKTAFSAIPAGIIGVFAGSFLAESLGDSLLKKFFGVFLVIIGLREFFAKPPAEDEEKTAEQK